MLENESRQKRVANPLNINISQTIRKGFMNGLQKLDSSLQSNTNPHMLQARNLAKNILKVESSPALMFQTVN